MRVLVAGGTGFIGTPVCRALRAAGHTVTVVTRDPEHAPVPAIGWETVSEAMRVTDALVNLAGEPIAAGRWTADRKKRILESRVMATRALVEAAAAGAPGPSLLINASAVGYYGSRGDDALDEAAEPGTGFLAEVCRAWESEAARVQALGMRLVVLRIGIVLGFGGGALKRILPVFRAFAGGPLGDGRQWMSWIHVDDVVGLVVEALGSGRYQGPVNATAPRPVTNREFSATLGRMLARPSWLPAPAFALRLALGEMAAMLLTGQRVLPKAAEAAGYRWRYPELLGALRASVRS